MQRSFYVITLWFRIPISLADLLGDGTVHDSVATIIIAIVLSLIFAGLIAIVAIIFCMRRHLCCFARKFLAFEEVV